MEVKEKFEEFAETNNDYPAKLTPANGVIYLFKEDPNYSLITSQTGYRVPSRFTMASYLDNFKWRMTGTENNKFDIPRCTYREI